MICATLYEELMRQRIAHLQNLVLNICTSAASTRPALLVLLRLCMSLSCILHLHCKSLWYDITMVAQRLQLSSNKYCVALCGCKKVGGWLQETNLPLTDLSQRSGPGCLL